MMHVKITQYIVVSIISIPILVLAQNSTKSLEQPSGNIFLHEFSDKDDSLSAQQIIELRADNGVPRWFARDIMKVVCLDETCRMVQLRLYWDGASNYLKFEIPENFPLTKTDHTVFSADDYKKLDEILSDANSILANLKQEELVVRNEREDFEGIDAISAATRPAFQNLLVSNAAYTCYTLWHTVYGSTQDKIKEIIEGRADKVYLKKIFELHEPNYLIWAINYLDKNPKYQDEFNDAVLDLLLTDNSVVANKAFAYFTNHRMINPVIQKELSKRFWKFQPHTKDELIRKYAGMDYISNEAFLLLLNQYEEDLITAGDLRKIFSSINPENPNDKVIQDRLIILSQGSNPFIKNLALKLIDNNK
jgi:hypothetical protein